MDQELYAQVKRSVKALLDINLDGYRDEQMRRRLDAWLARSGARTWPDYFRRIRVDPEELARFRNYLTINVSAFFRDPERWQTLRQHIL
ncbi:MAG: chemotaxis protein CheR, partial [Chloroflexota bacterium]